MMIDCSVLVVGVRVYFCFSPRKTLPKKYMECDQTPKPRYFEYFTKYHHHIVSTCFKNIESHHA